MRLICVTACLLLPACTSSVGLLNTSEAIPVIPGYVENPAPSCANDSRIVERKEYLATLKTPESRNGIVYLAQGDSVCKKP